MTYKIIQVLQVESMGDLLYPKLVTKYKIIPHHPDIDYPIFDTEEQAKKYIHDMEFKNEVEEFIK